MEKKQEVRMELFEKIYCCYYQVVRHILSEAAKEPITKNRMTELCMKYGYMESSLSIVPRLTHGQWPLLNKEFRSVLCHPQILQAGNLPLTALQKSWLKALLSDPRIRLFLSEESLLQAEDWLSDTEPLFKQSDFYSFDQYQDGDDYGSSLYQKNFHLLLTALKEKRALQIDYENQQNHIRTIEVLPCQLQYSSKNDRFRLCCLERVKENFRQKITLNVNRIKNCCLLEEVPQIPQFTLTHPAKEPVVIQISGERNSLERCMLHFANYEKHTCYDEEKKVWICSIYYDLADETELLIELLSFGPVIRVLGPERFLKQVQARVIRQHHLFYDHIP